MEDLIETKVNIMDYIDKLGISEGNKFQLKSQVEKKQELSGEEKRSCNDYITGVCSALYSEGKITQDDAFIIEFWEPRKKRKEVPKWKSFLGGIWFWRR